MLNRYELVEKVAERTHGTEGDPLSREEVETVADATVKILQEDLGQVLLVDDAMGTEDDLGSV